MSCIKRYFYNWLLLFDQALNTLFGGSPMETCSSRLGRHYGKDQVATDIADVLNWIVLKVFGQKDHCKISIESPDTYEGYEVLE